MTVCVLISCLQITVADMALCYLTDCFANQSSLDWGKFPKLTGLRDRVEKDNTKIAEWLAKRPVTPF